MTKMQALFLNGQIKNFCKQTSPRAPHNDLLPSAISQFMRNNIMLFSKVAMNLLKYLVMGFVFIN